MKKSILLFITAMLGANLAKADNIDYRKIEDYLNNIKTLEAGFVQMASNGGSAEGKIYIKKPSKIRMEYSSPDELLIIGNGDYIIYNDKELDQVTNIDYDDIPATVILSNKIKIDGKNLKVTDYYKDSGQTSITVEMPNSPNVKPITLIFNNSPFRLKQWKVVDQQNIEVTISLFDLKQDAKLGDNLFNFSKKKETPSAKSRRK